MLFNNLRGLKNRLTQSIQEKKEYESNYHLINQEIQKIRDNNNDTLVICLDNTESSFLGVKNATLNLFPKNTLILPAYYSNIKLTDNHLNLLVESIIELGFTQIIFGSLPASLNNMVYTFNKRCVIKVLFHGALTELSTPKNDVQFSELIKLCKENYIQRIGFVKSGLAEWASVVFDINSNWLLLFPYEYLENQIKIKDGKIHIGVFGNTSFNKNIHNQIAAALTIENSVIHTFASCTIFEEHFTQRIIKYPMMTQHEFVKLLSSMDLNMHLSFSEGMGGQTFTESLAQGVPCLTSYNNEYLKHSAYLSELLIVNQYENPSQIASSIKKVLNENKDTLKSSLLSYSELIRSEAEVLLHKFVSE